MLVEGGAVEVSEAVLVGGKVRRHPIEDHAKARHMRAIDEALEAGRIAEAPRGREQADGLVAPGGVERMLGYWQQLDMREAHIDNIGDKLAGEIVVGEKTIPAAAPPGAQMHLVDAHRPLPGARA